MANTTAVYARIDTKLKDNAESILSQLGISPSSAIQMLYSQIVLKKQLDKELQKGVDSINTGNVYSADEVDTILAKEFGI